MISSSIHFPAKGHNIILLFGQIIFHQVYIFTKKSINNKDGIFYYIRKGKKKKNKVKEKKRREKNVRKIKEQGVKNYKVKKKYNK
jgi:hypothetical protein